MINYFLLTGWKTGHMLASPQARLENQNMLASFDSEGQYKNNREVKTPGSTETQSGAYRRGIETTISREGLWVVSGIV